MYTSMTGIVYIYRIDMILSYPLMYSTLTIRPKIKTGNPSPIYHPKKIISQKKFTTSQIVPNPHTIHQNN